MTEDEGAPKMRHWSRGEVIALVGLFAAFISMVAAVIVVPDVRQWMGLEKPVIPSPISPPQSNGPTAPPNPARTARPERLRFVAEGLQRNDDRGLLLFLRRNSGKSVYLNVKFLAKCNTTTGATLDEVQTDCNGSETENGALSFTIHNCGGQEMLSTDPPRPGT